MSFGYSVGDAVLLVQLAWKTLQGTRKACGEHDELTREVSSLHRVLMRLERELKNPESLLNRPGEDRKQELREIGDGCSAILKVMNSILEKYNALPEEKRSRRKLWQQIRFGNGEMQDLSEIRLKLSTHTSAILMMVNLCSLGSQGRVETQLNSIGGELEGIRGKVDWIAANMAAKTTEGTMSVWTSYGNDDKALWRKLRRELNREGYDSLALHKHRRLIKQYVKELGNRGLFDQVESEDEVKEDNSVPEIENYRVEEERGFTKDESESDDNENGQDQLEAEGTDPPQDVELNPDVEGGQSGKSSALSQLLASDDNFSTKIPVSKSFKLPERLGQTGIASTSSATGEPQASNSEFSRTSNGSSTELRPLSSSEQIPKAVQIEDFPDEDLAPKSHTAKLLLDENSEVQEAVTSTHYLSENIAPHPEAETQVWEQVERQPAQKQPTETEDDTETRFIFTEYDQPQKDKLEVIKFQDALGRKFTFPFNKVRTWLAMEEIIRWAFRSVDEVGSHVLEGHYDLIGPHGDIILPQFWEDFVQPDWAVSMNMWSNAPGKASINERSRGSSGTPPHPRVTYETPVTERNSKQPEGVLNRTTGTSKPKSEPSKGILGWMARTGSKSLGKLSKKYDISSESSMELSDS